MSATSGRPLRSLAGLLAWVCAAAGTWGGPAAARADDRDLLRFNAAKPFVFILLDTSASMNLKVGAGDLATVGYGDDPASRIFAAKEALYTVFEDVDDVNYGFATLNQDGAGVVTKHWLYYLGTPMPAGWPLSWPSADPDGLTAVDDRGAAVNDVEGDALVFGPLFDLAPRGTAGSCAQPLDLSDATDRARVNAFAKMGDGRDVTTLWLSTGIRGRTYRLRLTPPVSGPPSHVGDPRLRVTFTLERLAGCIGPLFDDRVSFDVELRQDPLLNQFVMVDGAAPAGPLERAAEAAAGLWGWRDLRDSTTCHDRGQYFSGAGWEGNYDSGQGAIGDPLFDAQITDVDPFCADPRNAATCTRLKPMLGTVTDARGRGLDHGDMLPWDWQNSYHQAFLERLAPNIPAGRPDFGVARHLRDRAELASGVLATRNLQRKPIMALGPTSLDNAFFDLRCWYQGNTGPGGGCSDTFLQHEDWYRELACVADPEFGCRRSFFIIISDGINTCAGERPEDQARAVFEQSAVRVWALNVGDPANCSDPTNILHIVTDRGLGQCINIPDKRRLLETLEGVLGRIRTEARAFASAAVPTLRATIDQAIYVSSFVPFGDRAIWDGHLNAFRKPLPLDAQGRPDITHPNHLWDAGEVLRTTQYNAADPLGNSVRQRRVFYARERADGTLIDRRRLLDPVADATPDALRYDLWRGFGLIPDAVVDGALDAAMESALAAASNHIITATLAPKQATLDSGDPISYLLGDIFHSSPLVIDSPVDNDAFVRDLGHSVPPRACEANGSGERGFRCFFVRHQNRRRVLFVGSDDGMLHAFDTGIYDRADRRYDTGTGHELFAFAPRTSLPVFRRLADPLAPHTFTVDGSPVAGDVFIDPLHDGRPTAADRQWRTVLITGLREGGSHYFALDVTQPDHIDKTEAGEFFPDAGADVLPTCLTQYSVAACGPVPYASPLWEFSDDTYDSLLTGLTPAVAVPMDEDGNGLPDLGDAWSKPSFGRIRIKEGTDVVDKYVAVFGGGMDPERKGQLQDPLVQPRGAWLYMLDIESGKILYKRRLANPHDATLSGGSAPGDPAVVDTDGDGYFDRIYVATTGGFLYRVDVPSVPDEDVPGLSVTAASDLEGVTRTVRRILVDAGGTVVWQPRAIFDTNFDTSPVLAPTPRPRPIYQRPAVVFVAELGKFAVGFGTGDREDLWQRSDQEGRFYFFVDDTEALAPAELPLDESDLLSIARGDLNLERNLLLERGVGQRGWALAMDVDERVITDPFFLFGVTVFSSFVPAVRITVGECDPADPTCQTAVVECGRPDTLNFCAKTGFSNIFVVGSTNADKFLAAGTERSLTVSTLVTSPFAEAGLGTGPTTPGSAGGTADDLTPEEIAVMERLKQLFPPACRFSNQRIDIKTITADTRIQRIASVPVCVIERNWKEN